MQQLTDGGEDGGGIVEGSSKLPRLPSFVRFEQQHHLFKKRKIPLEKIRFEMLVFVFVLSSVFVFGLRSNTTSSKRGKSPWKNTF